MLTYQRNILKSRVNTVLGCLFLVTFSSACGLMIWNTSFGTDPLTESFAAIIEHENLSASYGAL